MFFVEGKEFIMYHDEGARKDVTLEKVERWEEKDGIYSREADSERENSQQRFCFRGVPVRWGGRG